MALVREFKSRTGGTIRIMDDCMAKTAEERRRRDAATMKVCCEILANTAAKIGVEATRELMLNGPHAYLLEGRL